MHSVMGDNLFIQNSLLCMQIFCCVCVMIHCLVKCMHNCFL